MERVARVQRALRHVEDGEIEPPEGEAALHLAALVPVRRQDGDAHAGLLLEIEDRFYQGPVEIVEGHVGHGVDGAEEAAGGA